MGTKPNKEALEYIQRQRRAAVELAQYAYQNDISFTLASWRIIALEHLAIHGNRLPHVVALSQPLSPTKGDTGYFTAKSRGFPVGEPSRDERLLELVDDVFARQWADFHTDVSSERPRKNSVYSELAKMELAASPEAESDDDEQLMNKEDAIARRVQRANQDVADPAKPSFKPSAYSPERLALRYGPAFMQGVQKKRQPK